MQQILVQAQNFPISFNRKQKTFHIEGSNSSLTLSTSKLRPNMYLLQLLLVQVLKD